MGKLGRWEWGRLKGSILIAVEEMRASQLEESKLIVGMQ